MSDIFDAGIALEQAADNENLARELFTMLLDELPDHRQAIDAAFRAVSSEDVKIDRLWDPVHKLHGATAYLGVPALRQAVKTFEDLIKQDNRDQLAEAFRQLDTEINRLLEHGREILTRNW